MRDIITSIGQHEIDGVSECEDQVTLTEMMFPVHTALISSLPDSSAEFRAVEFFRGDLDFRGDDFDDFDLRGEFVGDDFLLLLSTFASLRWIDDKLIFELYGPHAESLLFQTLMLLVELSATLLLWG